MTRSPSPRSGDPIDLPLGHLLFGDDVADRVTDTVHGSTAIDERRRQSFWQVAGEVLTAQVRQAATDLLGATPVDLLSSGWRMHDDLVAAARRTAARPGSSETVRIDRDEIEIADSLDVGVTIDGAPITTLRVAVVVVLRVGTLEARIADGRLHGVTWGDGDLAVELRLDDKPACSSPRLRLHRGATRTFDPGIVLVDHV
jgi:hypothetical protein